MIWLVLRRYSRVVNQSGNVWDEASEANAELFTWAASSQLYSCILLPSVVRSTSPPGGRRQMSPHELRAAQAWLSLSLFVCMSLSPSLSPNVLKCKFGAFLWLPPLQQNVIMFVKIIALPSHFLYTLGSSRRINIAPGLIGFWMVD